MRRVEGVRVRLEHSLERARERESRRASRARACSSARARAASTAAPGRTCLHSCSHSCLEKLKTMQGSKLRCATMRTMRSTSPSCAGPASATPPFLPCTGGRGWGEHAEEQRGWRVGGRECRHGAEAPAGQPDAATRCRQRRATRHRPPASPRLARRRRGAPCRRPPPWRLWQQPPPPAAPPPPFETSRPCRRGERGGERARGVTRPCPRRRPPGCALAAHRAAAPARARSHAHNAHRPRSCPASAGRAPHAHTTPTRGSPCCRPPPRRRRRLHPHSQSCLYQRPPPAAAHLKVPLLSTTRKMPSPPAGNT